MEPRHVTLTALIAAFPLLVPVAGHTAPPTGRQTENPQTLEPLSCDWLEQPGYEADVHQIPQVDPPDAPRDAWTLPRLPTEVSNTAELRDALADPTVSDIVLLPGNYDCDPTQAKPWLEVGDVHLWSPAQGDAVLHLGIQMQTPNGGLHGLSFEIDSPECGAPRYSSLGLSAAVVVQNGTNVAPIDSLGDLIALEYATTNVVLEDLTIDGNFHLTSGIRASAVSGLELSRITVRETRWTGIRIDTLAPDVYQQIETVFVPPLLTDLSIEQVSDPSLRDEQCWAAGISGPTYFPGRLEQGFFVGVTSTVRRVRIRDAAFMGLGVFTGRDAKDPSLLFGNATTLEHIDVDRVGPSSYLGNPHAVGSAIAYDMGTRGAQLSNFCVGPDTGRGVHFEYHGACAADEETGLCVTSFHDWRTQDVTLSGGLIDSAAQVSRLNLTICEEGQTGNEAYPLIDTQGSTGIAVGAHTEGIVTDDVTIRFSGCSGIRMESMNPDFGDDGILGCEVGDYGPDHGPEQGLSLPGAGTGGGPFGCSYNPKNPWYTPWCLQTQQLQFDLLDVQACEISNWKGWQCDDTELDASNDGCLQP